MKFFNKLFSVRSGFTAIEIVLTMGTLVMATGLAIPTYRDYLMRNDLEIARQNVSQGLQRAQFLAQIAMNDSNWGFSTDAIPGRGVLYMGDSFLTRDSDFDELYAVPVTVAITGVTEVNYEKITGLPSQIGDITLTAQNGEQRMVTVTIGDDGNVSVPEDWMDICVDPNGANPTTIQVPDSLWEYYETQGADLGACSEGGGTTGGGATCGNSVVETGEDCDSGGVDTVSCDSDCTFASCGDSYVNSAASEACDSGGVDTALCDSDCTAVSCGDSHVNSAVETCDDGGVDTATCDSDCTSVSCGDSHANSAAGETCDEGTTDTATCDNDCTAVTCTDGHLNTVAGEECDDGNTVDTDACTNACETAACGDNIVQPANGEDCDPSPSGQEYSSSCDYDCTAVSCGDGVVNTNASSPSGGEQCDDSNAVSTDACVGCKDAVCGDGFVYSGVEACDGGGSDTASCDNDCTAPSCGDGHLNTAAGETCDASGANTALCDSDCTAPSCGDSHVNTAAGETCDGGGSDTALCDSDCTAVTCGDGHINSVAGEDCDDGNTTNGDGCDSTCADEAGPPITIDDDKVTPQVSYTCSLKVLGAAITYGGSYDMPVTLRMKIGNNWIDPFGTWTAPVSSNLNDGQQVTWNCSSTYSSGTDIHMKARSWKKKYFWYSGNSNSHWKTSYTRTTETNPSTLIDVLKNGDDVPDVAGFNNQSSVQDFVSDYVNLNTDTMVMDVDEVIYLFELGTSDPNSSAADFQDLVLLLTITES